jgi:DNA adenine methylase
LANIWACSRRLKDVVIENLSYETIIPRYDEKGTLLYLDPPYYQAECYDVPFNFEDHLRLQELVCNCEGAFVALSYNDHPFIRELYRGFWQFTTTRPNPLGNRSGGGEYEELVITSYDPEVWSRPPQLSLFQTPEREPGEKKYTMIREGERNAEKRKEDGRAVRELLQQRYGKKRLCAGAAARPGGGDGKDRISSAADRSGMEQLPG